MGSNWEGENSRKGKVMIKDTEMTMEGRTRLEEGFGLEAESELSR